MMRAKPTAVAKQSTRSEILASMREKFRLLGEELDEEEWLKLTASEMEDRLMEMLGRAKARLAAGLAERPVTSAEDFHREKTWRNSTV